MKSTRTGGRILGACSNQRVRRNAVGAELGGKGPERKAAMRRRVAAGVPIGLLGYLEGEPVAWCSIALRTIFRALGGIEAPGERPEDVWSVTCFFAKRGATCARKGSRAA